MSDKYYRGLRNILNDTKHKLQLSSMTLKINENKNSISGIKNDISGINNFSDKINDNETNTSSNSSKINNNNNDIDEIRSNLNNIKNELTDFEINYSIQNLFIYNINVEKNYTLNKENPEFSIFSYNLEDDFKSNSILEFNCKILYNYTSYNNIGTLTHIFKLYDKNNELIHEHKVLKSNSGDNLSAYLNQNDVFYVKLNENYSIIKIELILSILDNISKSVSCKVLNTFKSNFLYVKHYKKINTLSINNNLTDLENDISSNLTKIDTNKGNISSNLTKIDTNKGNISSNLTKIDTNKGNISSNLTKIDTNKGNISSNLEKINDIENNLIVFDNIYNETLTIGNFTSISNFLIFFYETINFNFTTNGIIKIDAKYTYFENYNLTHIYKFYNNKKIFKEIKLDNISDIVNDKFEIQAINSTAIDIGIFYETNTGGNKEIKLVGDNTCRVSYFDNTPKTNKNKLDIASNLSKINNITNNIILKNLYTFIPFYDHDEYDPDGEKNRIPVNRLFFTKTFKMNIKKNDFIELNLRMFLEYEKLDDAHIVDTLIKFFGDNERIYFIKYRNGNFLAYGKYVFLNNNIIHHFEKDTKNLKIEIRFEYESTVFPLGVKKIWHVSRNKTDQWILKHYGN